MRNSQWLGHAPYWPRPLKSQDKRDTPTSFSPSLSLFHSDLRPSIVSFLMFPEPVGSSVGSVSLFVLVFFFVSLSVWERITITFFFSLSLLVSVAASPCSSTPFSLWAVVRLNNFLLQPFETSLFVCAVERCHLNSGAIGTSCWCDVGVISNTSSVCGSSVNNPRVTNASITFED